jgi:hypothetical protein
VPADRPRRPLTRGDWEQTPAHPADDPGMRRELAHATAGAVLAAARRDPDVSDDLLRLAETLGLDELAELWRDAGARTLPGTLWTLYLLRTWCRQDDGSAVRLFRAGRPVADVSGAIAGVAEPPGPQELADLGDAVLRGFYSGDLAVALERAAAFSRVVSAGRVELADDGPDGEAQLRLAAGNLACAEQLEEAARAWRAGSLH